MIGEKNIGYREAKRILAKQEEAREVINQYRGIETLGDRLGMKSNLELILTLFEIEGDEAVSEVLGHVKALYPDQWKQAMSLPPPEIPGELTERPSEPESTPQKLEAVEEKVLEPVA